MNNKSISRHLYIRLGILFFLIITEVTGFMLMEMPDIKNKEIYVDLYLYVSVAFPVFLGFWFSGMLIDTVVLSFQKKSYLRNINLIIILFFIVLALMVVAFFSKK